MRILLIADYLPYPLDGGDRIRIYNILRRLAKQHEVYLVAFLTDHAEPDEAIRHLQQFCVKVKAVLFPKRSRLMRLPGLLGYVLAGKPPELKLLYSDDFTAEIKELASAIDFDIVQIEHSRMGLYLEALPENKRYKSVLMFHNFTSQQYRRVSQIEQRWDRKVRAWLNGIAMGRWEPRYAEKFDLCTTVSEEDRQLLIKANPRLKVSVIPNGVDIDKYQPLPTENLAPVLLFVGNMEYPPCVDAVTYFCKEILPLIRKTIPKTEFWIVGRNPRPEVRKLNSDSVRVIGQVDDIVPYYQKSAVCVVPLRAGGGTRLKILEAMALGRPVVSTTIGCEGLDVIDNTHLLIADMPAQFADATIRLLKNKNLRAIISMNGRELVETNYSWDGITKKLMEVYSNMLS